MKPVTLIPLALLCAAASAHADQWTPQQQLSGPKDGYAGSSAAVDPRGDAVAAWIDAQSTTSSGLTDRIKARTRVAGAVLGPSSTVSVLDPYDQASDVRVYMSDTGRATALWSTNGNIGYADRPLGGHWSAARKISPTTYQPDDHSIVADHAGDQAIRVTYEVFVRRSGKGWIDAGSPVSFGHDPYFYTSGDLLISPSGDVLDRYTAFDFRCISTHHCIRYNFRNRWARLAPGQTSWTVSGDSDLITGDAHLLDDQGRLVFATQTGSGIVVQTQPSFGAPAITITTLPTTGKVTGFGADAAGNATVLVAEASANQTVTFVGPLGGGATWAKQLVVADTNISYGQSDFKVSASGSATLVWQAGGTATTTVFATTRGANDAFWSARVQLSPPNQAKAIDWLGTAANNQAIATWTAGGGSAASLPFTTRSKEKLCT